LKSPQNDLDAQIGISRASSAQQRRMKIDLIASGQRPATDNDYGRSSGSAVAVL
jgi:hypothetical protein